MAYHRLWLFSGLFTYVYKSLWIQNAMGYYRLWLFSGLFTYVHKSWWTQKAMGYHRLWVITVWVISGLTVVVKKHGALFIAVFKMIETCDFQTIKFAKYQSIDHIIDAQFDWLGKR